MHFLHFTHTHTHLQRKKEDSFPSSTMERRFLFSFILFQSLFWVYVSSRPLVPLSNHHILTPQAPIESPQSFQFTLTPQSGVDKVKEELMRYGKMNKIGSSPPNCQHRCYGCSPCEPTQVPTITSHFALQYTNYEPESWKCKCGPAFYSP